MGPLILSIALCLGAAVPPHVQGEAGVFRQALTNTIEDVTGRHCPLKQIDGVETFAFSQRLYRCMLNFDCICTDARLSVLKARTGVRAKRFSFSLQLPKKDLWLLCPCHPNPCHNRGTCEISETYRGDTFIGYVCKCPPGFSGVHCQHNINECERDPCKNGGICTDLVANYSCECPGEYMGRNCQYRCSGPLGMEGGIISNQQITASSTHRALFGLQKWYPYFARLNKKGLVNAWTAAENDRWPWIQINLQRRMRVTGLITQGAKRIGSPEYVKSYKVAYSDDGKTWRTYKVKGKDEDMIFRGNVDNNAPSANSFTPPIEAQYVRIYPQVCRRHCTLRMELLGCELTGCSEPLGMKSGHVQDYQVTASSIFRTLNMDMFTWEPGKARLDKQGKVNAWTAGHSDQSQWLQVDLLVPTKVTGVITQGAKDFGHVQFVGSYKVAYSNDGERWKVYQDQKQGKDK
ncbi:hypothetical protein F2P81_013824, partial [Scophthalmus maximus]